MEKLISDFLAQKRFAVAGSFKNESKYAFKILKMLKDKGHEVCPMHPTRKGVEGRTAIKTRGGLPVW